MSKRIYVGNLPYRCTEQQLEDSFKSYGEVTSVKIIKDKFSGRSKGFAFVEMASADSANKAIDALNGTELDGRKLNISIAREKTDSRF